MSIVVVPSKGANEKENEKKERKRERRERNATGVRVHNNVEFSRVQMLFSRVSDPSTCIQVSRVL